MSKVENVLSQIGVPFTSVERITDESFASEVYKITTAGPPQILKFAHSEVKFWRERRSLEFLNGQILVPQILEVVEPTRESQGAIVMECLPGRPIKAADIDKPLAFKCGELLAKLHLVATPGLGFFKKEGFEVVPFTDWWEYRRDLVLGTWTKTIEGQVDALVLSKAKTVLGAYYDSFGKTEDCYLHCDYRFGNILAADGEITGLIDFESARTGDPAYDFIKIHESIGHDSALWLSFQQGYRSLKALPDLEKTTAYYELDLNYGFLQWAVLRGDQELFKTRLATLRSLLARY